MGGKAAWQAVLSLGATWRQPLDLQAQSPIPSDPVSL